MKTNSNQTRRLADRVARTCMAFCVMLCWTQLCLAQDAPENEDVDDNQTIEIALSFKSGTTSSEALKLLEKLANQRTGKTEIQFVSGATDESTAKIKVSKHSPAKNVTALTSFFRENGINKLSMSVQTHGLTDPFKDMQYISMRVILRHDSEGGPQLLTKMFNPPPPELVKFNKRGMKASASIAGPKELDKDLILLRIDGPFQLHPFLEANNLLRQSSLTGNADVFVQFPFVDWSEAKKKVTARILATLQKPSSPAFTTQATEMPIGLPGPPHSPLGASSRLSRPRPGLDPFARPMAAESYPSSYPSPKSRPVKQSQLTREAMLADKKSQTKASELRSAGNSLDDQANARKALAPLVSDAFDAKQALYQAELDSLSERVARLKSLVDQRQKAKGQIIGRRIHDLLHPDLKWDATAADAAKSVPIPDRPVLPITSTRTNHFFVSSDPFAADPAHATVLENIAKTGESAYRELTQEWFGTPPIDFEKICGIDVQVTANAKSAQGRTSYRFTSDGKVADAMMHLQGSPTNLNERLTHEVMHLVLAANFKSILPRWIDEGIAMTAGEISDASDTVRETVAEAANDETLIPLHELFTMTSYPPEQKRLKLMYSQSHRLVEWLVSRGGKRKLIECMQSVPPEKMASQLPDAILSTYGFENVADLESQWIDAMKQSRSH